MDDIYVCWISSVIGMKFIRIVLLLFFAFTSYVCAFAQANHPLLQKKLKFNYWDYIKYMNQEHTNLFNGIYYNRTIFDNAPLLKSSWETKFSFGATIYPIRLEGSCINGNMKIEGEHSIPIYSKKNYKINLRRIIFSVSVYPPILYYAEKIFSTNLMSDRILPYAGIGWQGTNLRLTTQSFSDDKFDYNSLVWKIGCSYSIKNSPITGVIEYERSFHGMRQKRFQSISIGITVEWQVLKTLLNTNYRYIPRS